MTRRRLSEQKPRREAFAHSGCRERELGATPSEIGQKTYGKPEGLSYGVKEHVVEDTCETWDCTRRSVAGHVASRGKPDVNGGPDTGNLHGGGT